VNYDNSFLVTITVIGAYGHHRAVTIYLHVAPSTFRHTLLVSGKDSELQYEAYCHDHDMQILH